MLAAEAEDGREVERLRVHEVCLSTVEKVEPLPIGRSAGHLAEAAGGGMGRAEGGVGKSGGRGGEGRRRGPGWAETGAGQGALRLPERAALARLPVLCDSGVERRVGRGRGRRHLAVALDAQGRGGEVVLVAHLLAPLVEADPSRAVDAARVVEAVQLETLSLGERARLGQQADDLRLLRRQAADRRLRRACGKVPGRGSETARWGGGRAEASPRRARQTRRSRCRARGGGRGCGSRRPCRPA